MTDGRADAGTGLLYSSQSITFMMAITKGQSQVRRHEHGDYR